MKKRPRLNDIISPITVETMVNGGAGLARHQGQVVFIPHAAVGDTVSCRVTKSKKNFLQAEVVEILKPASVRRQPICPVAGECGGCQWQHLPYSEQLSWKESLFRESLIRRCGIDPAKILPIVPAADEWNYRSRVQIKCHNSAAGFVTGFYRPQSHHIVSVEKCPIIASVLNPLLVQLCRIINHTPDARYIQQLDLAVGDHDKCSVLIHYAGDDPAPLAELLQGEELAADLLIKAAGSSELIKVCGDGIMQISVDSPPIRLRYAVGGFAQINLQQNLALVDNVLDLAGLTGSERVVDLYCGMGNFSLPLARRALHVIGIEESAVSIEMARQNSRLNNIDNVDFYSQPAEGAWTLFSKQQSIDLLVLDPPRSGAAVAMEELLKTPVKRVLYISCDPQTLARDLSVLVNGGYDLVSSQPFDMFPQTHHCESVTLLHYRS